MKDWIEEQAQSYTDWAEYKRLSAKEWLDSDEAQELWHLRDALGIPHPEPEIYADRPFTYEEHLHFEQKQFIVNIWSKQVIDAYQHNLILAGILSSEKNSSNKSGSVIGIRIRTEQEGEGL